MPAPTLSRIEPNVFPRGTNGLVVTLSGADFEDESRVTFSGGVVLDSVEVVSDTEITASISVPATASGTETGTVTVINPDNHESRPQSYTIEERG